MAGPAFRDGEAWSGLCSASGEGRGGDLVMTPSANVDADSGYYRELFDNVPIALVHLDMRPLLDRLAALGVEDASDFADLLRRQPSCIAQLLELPTIEGANPEAVRLFDARDIAELCGPIAWAWRACPGTIERSLMARLSGAPRYSEETRVNRLDGSSIDVLYTITFTGPLVERGANVVGFVDIRERKRADEELRKSERRYRDLFEHVPIALWQVDTSQLVFLLQTIRDAGVVDLSEYIDRHPDFLLTCMDAVTVQEVNAATVDLLEADRAEEFLGRPVRCFWEMSPETFRRSIQARYAGASGYTEETVLRTLKGRAVDVVYSISFLPTLQELGITLIGTLDIRGRRRAEARLQQMQAELAHSARISTLGELTASIAHEVKQPLTAISALSHAMLGWLRRAEPDLGELETLASDIREDALRASDIIDRIRGMAAKHDAERQLVSINELIRQSLLIVRHQCVEQGVAIRVDLEEGMPPLHADRVQIQQVIVNLALNAIQAMQDGADRLITVTSRNEDHRIVITVDDTGPGISPQNMDQLFAGFFTTKESGMGMGLAICRSIVHAHNGQIVACNHRRGARFIVTLPIQPGC